MIEPGDQPREEPRLDAETVEDLEDLQLREDESADLKGGGRRALTTTIS